MKIILLYLAVIYISGVSAKIYFEDCFPNGDISKWKASEAEKDKLGKCQFAKPEPIFDEKEDGGINTTEAMRYYRYSAPFDMPLSNKDKAMCVQFSVKYAKGIACAGGYVKLMGEGFKPHEFDGNTSYEIMFGPDHCGYQTRQVHVIFSYEGKNHLLTEPIHHNLDDLSHLYTLLVFPNNTFTVKIDQEVKRNGSLVDDFPMLKPRTINDPNSIKPDDWVDEPTIIDPNAKKPDDYDQPEKIPDPNATKPDDWDDETDGQWKRPTIPNPNFKGPWFPKRIPNPAFKGEWKANQIPNPAFVDDPNLYSRTFKHIGLDLWQVQSGTLFDNFIVSDDPSECEAHTKHWKHRFDAEVGAKKQAEEKARAEMKNRRLKEDTETAKMKAEYGADTMPHEEL